jgi:hypothetical protein
MHVVIGSTGMQQGLAFYQRLLLPKILEIFNSSVLHERTVFDAPHHSHTSIQWKQIRNSTPITVIKATENYSTRRDDRVDIKNAKNGAKTTKLWQKQVLGLFCK